MIKPKVLILGKLPPPYMGPSLATEIILKSTLSKKYLLIHQTTKAYSNLKQLGKFNLFKLTKNISNYLGLATKLIYYRPDITLIPISQTTIGFIKDAIFIWISASFGTKTIIQLRGSNFLNWARSSNTLTQYFIKKTLSTCCGVIVLGNNLKYLFSDYFHNNQIFVVPNGKDCSTIQKEKQTQYLRLLYFGNFVEGKGFFEILKAINSPKYKSLNLAFTAVGNWLDNDYEELCKSYINENSLNIEILTEQSGLQKDKIFSNSDIFIFTPIEPEGHPWVIIEAMAAGLPIITTDQGAIIESVIDGENGIILKSIKDDLVSSIEHLYHNRKKALQMGSKGEKQYQRLFREQNMVNNLDYCFKLILNSTN